MTKPKKVIRAIPTKKQVREYAEQHEPELHNQAKWYGVAVTVLGLFCLYSAFGDLLKSLLISLGVFLLSLGFTLLMGKTVKKYLEGKALFWSVFIILLLGTFFGKGSNTTTDNNTKE